MSDHRDDGRPDEYCMMCMRSEKAAGKLIRMPGNIRICQDCMQRSMDMMGNPDFLKQLHLPDAMDPSLLFGNNFPFGGVVSDPAPDQNGGSGQGETQPQDGQPGGNRQTGGNADQSADGNGQSGQSSGHLSGQQAGPGAAGSGNGEDVPGNEPGPGDEGQKQDGGKNPQNPFGGRGIIFNLGNLFGQPQQPHRRQSSRKKEGVSILDLKSIPAPHKIKAMLDEYVIGQDYAKKVLSVSVYNHYKRIFTNTMDEIEIEKSNVLMLGPTGCGKTYLVRTLARVLDVPLAISDATSLTEAGYIGDDIESVVSKLLSEADEDVERCEQGIVFIDEIDKIAKKKNAHQRDVSGESVQQGLLSLLEGSIIDVPVGSNSKNAMVPMATVNTRNILFICAGAFPGLEDVIKERLNRQASIGFGADLKDRFDEDPDILSQATPEDLRKYGMIPEFIGRLPIICALRSMTKEMLISIMTDPKNAILKQYQKLLELDEVKLEFDETALDAIAQKALDRKTGARGLRAVIEDIMLDIMYEIPKDENIGSVCITSEYIEKKGLPLITIREHPRMPKQLPEQIAAEEK